MANWKPIIGNNLMPESNPNLHKYNAKAYSNTATSLSKIFFGICVIFCGASSTLVSTQSFLLPPLMISVLLDTET